MAGRSATFVYIAKNGRFEAGQEDLVEERIVLVLPILHNNGEDGALDTAGIEVYYDTPNKLGLDTYILNQANIATWKTAFLDVKFPSGNLWVAYNIISIDDRPAAKTGALFNIERIVNRKLLTGPQTQLWFFMGESKGIDQKIIVVDGDQTEAQT